LTARIKIIDDLRTENKQLKEDSQTVRDNYKLLNSDFDKCIVERDNLKQKLEKIRTIMDDHKIICGESETCAWHNSQLKEILGDINS